MRANIDWTSAFWSVYGSVSAIT